MAIPEDFFARGTSPSMVRGGQHGNRVSRCFQTTAEGRIALTSSWDKVFGVLQRFGDMALQSRHAYARIVITEPAPRFTHFGASSPSISDDGALRLHPASWLSAWARIEHCDCCGSPGRVEFLNHLGDEFLQICAVPRISAHAWADAVAEMVADGSTATEAPTVQPMLAFPQACAHAKWLPPELEVLSWLLQAVGKESIELSVTLQTAEACHTSTLCPHRVSIEQGVLTFGAGSKCVQLGLPAVRAFAVDISEPGWPLSVVGPDGVRLLRITASASDTVLWRAALCAAFPVIS